MKQMLCTGLCLMALLGGSGRLLAQQITAVQFSQSATTINLQSQRRVPISTNVNAAIGSDGKMPATSFSYLSRYQPTTNQFVALMTFGAVTAATNNSLMSNNAYLQETNAFSLTVASNMQLPIGSGPVGDGSYLDGSYIVLRRASVGGPYVSQAVNYFFGSIIPPPANDITNGVLINNPNYWLAAPYTNGNYVATNPATFSSSQFYYSPNAGVVFATKAGPISITWITAQRWAANALPAYTNLLGPLSGVSNNYVTNCDGSLSALYTASYIVSPSPVKQPQSMYWTEGPFANLGHPVVVPAGRLSAINVIYNASFPSSVATPYPDPNSTIDLSTNTLWYDKTAIRAYNAVGQVFVELLGAPNGNGGNQCLGFEIVDVAETPATVNLTNYLGDQLIPYQDPTLGANLAASPLNNEVGTPSTTKVSSRWERSSRFRIAR